MTVEHRFIAELGDIRGVTCECKKCGVRLGLSPDTIRAEDLYECPSCRHRWLPKGVADQKNHASDALLFLLMLAPVRKGQRAGTDSEAGVRILLEFDCPKATS